MLRPYERVYVRDVIRLSLDDMVAMMSSLEAVSAYWAGGILFASFAMTESEELARKEMHDEMYLDRVVFTEHPEYTKTVKSSTNLEIGVLNVDSSGLYRDLALWARSQAPA